MTIGILGAGQLGRMLALAGIPLGYDFRFLDASEGESVAGLGDFVRADYEDHEALLRWAAGCECITFEFENVPADAIRAIGAVRPVAPGARALEVSQDRLVEKRFFRTLGIATPSFAEVDSLADLESAAAAVGLPALLKTRRFGYDGKGQRLARSLDELPAAWNELGGAPSILEAFVPFDRELSVLSVRSAAGEIAHYPLVENHHSGGILRQSLAPAGAGRLAEVADAMARSLLEEMDYVGLLALELFQVGEQLLANEMAPRVHNSGHWTIEGAETSQFENHLRAVMGLPLGSTDPRGASAMINLVGFLPEPAVPLGVQGAHLHRYGKTPRPGRKVGHITLTAADAEELEVRLCGLRAVMPDEVARQLPATVDLSGLSAADFPPSRRRQE